MKKTIQEKCGGTQENGKQDHRIDYENDLFRIFIGSSVGIQPRKSGSDIPGDQSNKGKKVIIECCIEKAFATAKA